VPMKCIGGSGSVPKPDIRDGISPQFITILVHTYADLIFGVGIIVPSRAIWKFSSKI
jgi:hypothetical protein